MLAPYNAILVHKTLCQTHVGPMLGPSWAHTTLYWGYLGPMLAPCYAHVGPFSSTYKFLTLFKNHGKTQYSRAKKPPPPKLKLYQWLSHDFRTPSPQKTPQHLRCGRILGHPQVSTDTTATRWDLKQTCFVLPRPVFWGESIPYSHTELLLKLKALWLCRKRGHTLWETNSLRTWTWPYLVRWFIHQKWWFSIVFCMFTRG